VAVDGSPPSASTGGGAPRRRTDSGLDNLKGTQGGSGGIEALPTVTTMPGSPVPSTPVTAFGSPTVVDSSGPE